MANSIKNLITREEIEQSYEAFLELRPHLKEKNVFVDQIISQFSEGYRLKAIVEGHECIACMGFRLMSTLAWGKILYIDDLITKEKFQGKGYGVSLLECAMSTARQENCGQVHLDTGYTRHAAHKVYLKYGFEFSSHHLSLKLI